MTQNQIAYWKNQEDKRSHLAQEKETNRANKAREAYERQRNDNTLNLGLLNYGETNRSNLAREGENFRTNTANESIKQRQNDINEYIAQTGRYNADINYANALTNAGNLAEMSRSNRVNETIKAGQLLETERSNKAQEKERNRSNIANENISRFVAATNSSIASNRNSLQEVQNAETNRHNVATELETKRKNLIDQQLAAARLQNDITQQTARTQLDAMGNVLRNFKISVPVGTR